MKIYQKTLQTASILKNEIFCMKFYNSQEENSNIHKSHWKRQILSTHPSIPQKSCSKIFYFILFMSHAYWLIETQLIHGSHSCQHFLNVDSYFYVILPSSIIWICMVIGVDLINKIVQYLLSNPFVPWCRILSSYLSSESILHFLIILCTRTRAINSKRLDD